MRNEETSMRAPAARGELMARPPPVQTQESASSMASSFKRAGSGKGSFKRAGSGKGGSFRSKGGSFRSPAAQRSFIRRGGSESALGVVSLPSELADVDVVNVDPIFYYVTAHSPARRPQDGASPPQQQGPKEPSLWPPSEGSATVLDAALLEA